jgi:hypothetical protein
MTAQADLGWQVLLSPGGRWSGLVTAGSSAARAARHTVGVAYLAAPYQAEVAIRGEWRMDRSVRLVTLAAIEAARLLARGCVTVCPVLARAEMCQAGRLAGISLDPLSDPAWGDLSTRLRNVAGLVVVPDLPGWDRCPAILADVAWAVERTVPVHVYGEAAG